MLVPELQKEHLSTGAVNSVIRNWGQSAASDVHVDVIDPAPPADLDTLQNDVMLKWLYRSYAAPITLWPPRWLRCVQIWGVNDDKARTRTLSLGLWYEGSDGYDDSEAFTRDPAPVLFRAQGASSQPCEDDLNGWVKDIGTSLRALARTCNRPAVSASSAPARVLRAEPQCRGGQSSFRARRLAGVARSGVADIFRQSAGGGRQPRTG
ncbi:hypothetical protein DXX98_13075 [Janibacter melonis]|nr:hypothetical protein [Janibacter melonis]